MLLSTSSLATVSAPSFATSARTARPCGRAFSGTLTAEQKTAADALMAHDTGVLAATTAFGKTVVAIKLIAERDRNTLILVHRQQLLDQWVARLQRVP